MSRTPKAPRLKVNLTEEIIKDAIPRDSGHCMYADAVRASYPDAAHVAVDLQTVRFSDLKKGLRYTYLTPRIWQVSLIKFDQGIYPEAFSLELRNGQVTLAGKRRPPSSRQSTPAQKKALAKANTKRAELLKKQRMVDREKTGAVPDRVGGKTPPVAPGRRRAFGLRALER